MVLSMVPAQAFAEETVPETVAPTETEAAEQPLALEETPTEQTLAPETTAEETLVPEAPVEESLAPEETVQETEATVEETEPVFEAELQPRSASGDCSAEDNWNSTNDVSWVLDDNGTLTISGTGQMRGYSNSSTAPWFSERLNVKNVVIENGVTHVGSYAFY